VAFGDEVRGVGQVVAAVDPGLGVRVADILQRRVLGVGAAELGIELVAFKLRPDR
jgi:hypothetical protein